MKKILVLLIIMFSANTHAGFISYATITKIGYHNDGVIIIYTDKVIQANLAVCTSPASSDFHQYFSMNATTAGGKIQFAGILSAYVSGKRISIVGSGGCLYTMGRYYEALDFFSVSG